MKSTLIESLARGFKLDMLANTLLNKITLSEKKAIIKSNEIFLYPNMTTAKRFLLTGKFEMFCL